MVQARHEGRPAPPRVLAEHREHLPRPGGIDRGHRLVGEQESRVLEEGAGDRDTLRLPPGEEEAWLDERAADYHDLFLSPQGGPLVQSLWTEGRYEGTPAARIRQLAASAGLELDGEAARGAAPDHLGCILRLWCATREAQPEVAGELCEHHLSWSLRPLERIAHEGGLYGGLARITLGVVREISSSGVRGEAHLGHSDPS